jgi:hypothetical protein
MTLVMYLFLFDETCHIKQNYYFTCRVYVCEHAFVRSTVSESLMTINGVVE